MTEILAVLANFPWWAYAIVFIVFVAIWDIFVQKRHTIKHNFPVVGHLRYWLESIGPEMRQYFVANNREELPFNRIERGWIYASAKQENNYEGFGSDRDLYAHQHVFIKNRMMAYKAPEGHPNLEDKSFMPCAKVMGVYNKRKRPYRPASIINVSAMSFGSLSAAAVEAMNKGVHKASAYHNTGEGGLSPYHKQGGDVVFHFGTGYFGVRTEDGNFSMDKMKKLVADNPCIRAIEIKLSQGAKPGKGGVLPGAKITEELAEIRGVEVGKDVLSPATHKAFSNVTELMQLIEAIATETGLPVGIKGAIGKLDQWEELADLMLKTGKGPDFITVDGGEGGTGAAPPSFADHVSLAMAFAMGVDCINVAREAMMSIGCIQAQVCHTNRCPAGIATQNKWLQKGVNVPLKSDRLAQYFKSFRKEFLEITHAAGYEHPCQFTMDDIQVNVDDNDLNRSLASTYGYNKVKVDFKGVEELKDCSYLGGK